MKNLFVYFLMFLLFSKVASAQMDEEPGMSNFTLYADIGTFILAYSSSINMEVYFGSSTSKKIHWYGRGGFAAMVIIDGSTGAGGIGAVTMLTGKDNHHFDISGGVFLGVNPRADLEGDLQAGPILELGYRYQKPGKGLLFRAKVGILGVGVGLGYAF